MSLVAGVVVFTGVGVFCGAVWYWVLVVIEILVCQLTLVVVVFINK